MQYNISSGERMKMQKEMLEIYLSAKNSGALIHCITNPISINQCANAILALGCKPIMAEHPREVKGITLSSKALLLNLGNITDARIKSVKIAAKTADENNIPFILDAVGVACSQLRRGLANKIIRRFCPKVIKGNYSEINALCHSDYSSIGVDADAMIDTSFAAKAARTLAKKYGCVILASGKTDIVTDGEKTVYINNGTEQLAFVTGTGCMLGALNASLLPFGNALYATALACGIMGIAGERAQNGGKNGSFVTGLLDEISVFDADTLKEKLNIEVI